MSWQLEDYRLVTASAYPGMMAPLTAHPSCVCVLSGDADPSPAATSISLERLYGERRRWQFADLAELAPRVPAGVSVGDRRPLVVVPPRASEQWSAATAVWPSQAFVAASPRGVADRIADDKAYVRDVLGQLGVPTPAAVVVDRAGLSFRRLRARLGTPFVIQVVDGAGGQGTYRVRAAADLAAVAATAPAVPRWLASSFAGTTTINVAGVVFRDGFRLFPASLQVSGIDEIGSGFGSYGGSQFGALAVGASVQELAANHTAVIAKWLQAIGHLGLFGVDFAVAGADVLALEINPRIQGSSGLLATLQIGPSCLEQHVMALLGAPIGRVLATTAKPQGQSQVVVRWRGDAGVVTSVSPVHADPGVRISGRPAVGVGLRPQAILARITSPEPLTSGDGHQLRPAVAALVARVHESVRVGVRVLV